jgi:Ni,Fe-hydrogenase I large subunit
MAKSDKPETFDFKTDQQAANKIEDLQDRLQFFKQRKKEYAQYLLAKGYPDFENLAATYQVEIEYLQDLIKSQQQGKVKPGKPNQSIWWKKSGRLLKYLMDELARLDYIDRESPVNKHIKEHFIDRERNPFTDSIKQNSSGAGLNKSGKPKGHEDVDSLINSLKDKQDRSE